MKFEPLRDVILLERDESVKKSDGGIIMTQNSAEQPPEGVVLAVGPGRVNDDGAVIPMSVKVGDRVLFASNSGYPVSLDEMKGNDKLVVMAENEVIAILR